MDYPDNPERVAAPGESPMDQASERAELRREAAEDRADTEMTATEVLRRREHYARHKAYLGDSVYVDFDGDSLILTTNNGYPDDPRNRIVLEPEVYDALIAYARRLADSIAATP